MTALPHDLAAEQCLLGSLIFANRTLDRLCALTPAHFYDPVHGRIFAEIVAGARAGRLVDELTLKQRMAGDEALQELGGGAYLMRLAMAATPLAAQAVAYAEMIRDLALRRDVLAAARAVAALALKPPEGMDGVAVLAEAERLLRAVEAGGEGGVTLRAAARLAVDNAAKGERGIKTGFATVDALIGGLFAPDLIVLAGRPAMGKTSIAANIAHAVALRGYGVHFGSLEMGAEQIAQRALSRAGYGNGQQFPYRSFRRGGVPIDFAGDLADRMPENFVIDDNGGQTLAQLAAAARATRRRLGQLDLIVVDYLQLMRDEAVKRGETAEVTALTKGLKQLAKDLDVPIILLSQLSREVERRQDKRPQLSDLRQSGSIEQDADIVLFAFRENYYLTRAKPTIEDGEKDIDFDLRYHKWADRCEETSGRMELIASKTRMDETGSNFLLVDLAYDVAADLPSDQPRFHTPTRNRGSA